MSDFKARATVYKGIQMRSRLEAGFAAWLDWATFDWEYESRAFADDQGQYLPDFKLNGVGCSWLPNPATVYVEIKPRRPDVEAMLELLDQMTIIWSSEPDAVLIIVIPSIAEDNNWTHWVGKVVDINGFRTTVPYIWCHYPGGKVGLGQPIIEGPWPDGYWKVRGG